MSWNVILLQKMAAVSKVYIGPKYTIGLNLILIDVNVE